MPDSICIATMLGLTATPQSTAQTTRSMCTASLRRESSTTCATKVLKDSCTAMPRARSFGSGLPQPACLAASSNTPRWRGCLASRLRRKANGSLPVARAMSSRKHSVANAVCVEPTERHHCTGTPTFGECSSTSWFGIAYGRLVVLSSSPHEKLIAL